MLQNNPSIRNWYYDSVMQLTCTAKFLHGFTTPQLNIEKSSWEDNPHLQKVYYPMQYLKGHCVTVIKNLIDDGFYVNYNRVDDYYIPGKTWYKQRHFSHDGLICGYDQADKSFMLYAYDNNWIYRKFKTTQSGFSAGRASMFRQDRYGMICGIKPCNEEVLFNADVAVNNIRKYLKQTPLTAGKPDRIISGYSVQEYLLEYLKFIQNGDIPHERVDKRILRLIWEHKRAMTERLKMIEQCHGFNNLISSEYQLLASEMDTLRMLYASYCLRQRSSLLPIIRTRLMNVQSKEFELLTKLIEKER